MAMDLEAKAKTNAASATDAEVRGGKDKGTPRSTPVDKGHPNLGGFGYRAKGLGDSGLMWSYISQTEQVGDRKDLEDIEKQAYGTCWAAGKVDSNGSDGGVHRHGEERC